MRDDGLFQKMKASVSIHGMKAILVMDSISRAGGGLLEAEVRLQQELDRLGVPTSVFGLEDSFSESDIPRWGPLLPRVFRTVGMTALGASPDMRRELLAENADLIYRVGLWRFPSRYAHEWSRQKRRPEVIAPHGMLDPWAVRHSGWKKRLARLWFEGAHLRDAACIRALCQSEADSIRAYGLKNPVCIIANGVDLPLETQDGKTQDARGETEDGSQRTEVGGRKSDDGSQRKEGRKVLLFLGRLHPKKGIASALRAWGELQTKDQGPRTKDSWTFAIAGWDQGGHEAELKQLCDELGLAWSDIPAAEFVGPLCGVPGPSSLVELGGSQGTSQAGSHEQIMHESEAHLHDRPRTTDHGQRTATSVAFLGPAFGETKAALLRQADAFILPSFSEGLPMSVLEAWSYRLPVLMTDHCNLPEGFANDAAMRIGTEVGESGQGTGVRSRGTGTGGQPMGIAGGMRELLEMSDGERATMGQNGRLLVERQFTWTQVAAQMKEVYEWVLGGGERPDCVSK